MIIMKISTGRMIVEKNLNNGRAVSTAFYRLKV